MGMVAGSSRKERGIRQFILNAISSDAVYAKRITNEGLRINYLVGSGGNMATVSNINQHKELRSNQGQSKEFMKHAKLLEKWIKMLREMERQQIFFDVKAGILDDVISEYIDKMNEFKRNAISLRGRL